MKEIKISERLENLLKDRNYNIQNEQTSDIFLSREKENQLLKKFGFNESDNVDINDFFQFARYFGIDKELYLEFITLKKDADVSWEDIKNLKWGDIDLEKGIINFPNQKIKKERAER